MIRSLTLVAALAAVSGSALASPLNLVRPLLNPDVSAATVAVSYNAGTGAFSATGNTQNGDFPPNGGILMGNRTWSLTCSIDNSGNIAPGSASLTVRGDANASGGSAPGANALIFSSATLSQFGFGATDKLEFVFSSGSGIWWTNASYTAGVILVLPGAFTSNGGVPRFTQNFNYNIPNIGNADTFLIPAPGGMAVLGLAGLAAIRRRR